jgi:hypothetical protein
MSETTHADSAETYEGHCLCGFIRYRAEGEPVLVAYCHCRSCTLASGAHAVAWATFPRDRFRITAGTPAENPSSAPVVRTFCPRCGSALTYTHAERPGEIDVTFSTIEDPKVLVPMCHVWVSNKRAWAPIGDDLPRFSEWPGSPLVE